MDFGLIEPIEGITGSSSGIGKPAEVAFGTEMSGLE
jgi:hypothetical protein